MRELGALRKTGSFFLLAAALALVAGACGEETEPTDASSASTTQPAAPTTTTVIDVEARLETSEAFIDAFYSFDPAALEAILESADESSQMEILYYQGWAEGGNYEILKRKPCAGESEIRCAITVKDDLVGALQLDFDVTDTFILRFSGEQIASVGTESNDPQEVGQAFEWVDANYDFEDNVCQDWFAGGTTPGECIKAIVAAFAEFRASDDFPDSS